MKNAEDRYLEKQFSIKLKGQEHSSFVAQKNEDYKQMMNTRYEEGFAKNVNKAMKTKENVKTLKEKRLSETVEGL